MSAGELYRRLFVGDPVPIRTFPAYYAEVRAALREAAADFPYPRNYEYYGRREIEAWFEKWMAGITAKKGDEDAGHIRQVRESPKRPACFGRPFSVEGCYDCAYFAACVLLKTAELFERDREMAGK